MQYSQSFFRLVDYFCINSEIMRIDVLSGVPDLMTSPVNHSIIKRARDKGLAEVYIHNLRDYSKDKHKKIDDYAFSGEAGMVLSIEPIDRALQALKDERDYEEIIYTSPDGELFNQSIANQLSTCNNIVFLCGHYKGIDQRVRDHLVTRELSIGDYVMTGGELAAAVMIDSIIRLLPGVLSDETSALSDSFQDGLLAPPVYTRPAVYKDWDVPPVLMSGNTAKIEKWKHEQSIERTRRLRPGLLDGDD